MSNTSSASPSPSSAAPSTSFPRWLRISFYSALIFSLLLLVLGVFAIYALPSLLRPWLETQASSVLHRQVSIGEIHINPYTFRFSMNDVAVKDAYGVFVEFKQLSVDAEISSLIRMAPVLREITLDQARVNVVRLTRDQFNFTDLIPPKDDKDTPLPLFSINNIRLTNAQVRLDDRFIGKTQVLDQLNIALPFVSNFAQRIDEYIQPAVSGRFNGESFALQVKSKPFKDSLETALSMKIDAQDMTKFLPYLPLPEGLAVPTAVLRANVDLVFRQQAKRADLVLNGQVQLNDFALTAQGAALVGFKQLKVEIKDMKPLLQEFRFGKIALNGLDLAVVRDAKGEINWQKQMGNQNKAATPTRTTSPTISPTPTSSSGLQWEVAQLQVLESQIHWQDARVAPAVRMTLGAMDVNVQNLSSKPESHFPLVLQTMINMGAAQPAPKLASKAAAPLKPLETSLKAELDIALQPLNVSGKVQVSGLQAEKFAPYYKAAFPANLAAKVGLAAELKWNGESMQYALDKAALDIENLAVTLPKQKKPALQIKQFQLMDVSLDSTTRLLTIPKLESANADMQLVLLKDGTNNFMQALPQEKGKIGPSSSSSSSSSASASGPAWRVQLAKAHIASSQIKIQDESVENAKPLVLKNIDVQLKNLDTNLNNNANNKVNTKAGVSAQLAFKAAGERGAKIAISGPFVPQPFSGKFKLDLNQLDAVAGQPYFSKYLNISLASGFVHAAGELQLATQGGLSGSYKGVLRSTNFYALDKNTGADFLKWSSLAFMDTQIQFKPLAVNIGEIALTDFYSRLILSGDGRLNLQDVTVQNGESVSVTTERSAKPAPAQAAPVISTAATTSVAGAAGAAGSDAGQIPVTIGKITLAGGNITYSDLFIKPNFTANLTDMAGIIGGISSQNESRATVDLRGSVDRIAPVEIRGTVNPLGKNLFIDLKGGVKGYELTNASAYAIKYAGYGIQKGKLSMDVSYLIENNKLKASNQLFLDQLTLGEPVASPTATKLPVRFALSLLTDRNGQIKLNLPIEGSLEDPQFSVGGIIFQVIGNILQKVVTAPFAVLGSLFSSGPSLSHIEYPAGRAVLDDKAKDALENLAKLLNDRPKLSLEISGWASLENDADGLRQQILNNRMLAIKAASLGQKAESVNSVEEVALSDKEVPELMAQVYKKEPFPKPKNLVGLNKGLPVPEMQKLILANIALNDENLKVLAMQRAQRVKNALKDAGVDDARMFITEAKIRPASADVQEDKGSLSRVQFVLK